MEPTLTATMNELSFLYDGLFVELKGMVVLLTGGASSHTISYSSESKHDLYCFPALFIK